MIVLLQSYNTVDRLGEGQGYWIKLRDIDEKL